MTNITKNRLYIKAMEGTAKQSRPVSMDNENIRNASPSYP